MDLKKCRTTDLYSKNKMLTNYSNGKIIKNKKKIIQISNKIKEKNGINFLKTGNKITIKIKIKILNSKKIKVNLFNSSICI